MVPYATLIRLFRWNVASSETLRAAFDLGSPPYKSFARVDRIRGLKEIRPPRRGRWASLGFLR